MKKVIIIAALSLSFCSCYCGTHLYYMEEIGTHRPLLVRDWGNYKIGQIVEEGRGTYKVISVYDNK